MEGGGVLGGWGGWGVVDGGPEGKSFIMLGALHMVFAALRGWARAAVFERGCAVT